ncbi:hypothetical protein SAE02_38550 [Skermanella aerolata]|uniref:Uncharacterized protein n=1 Tax=Skermanella aerolata TaxID=393310 RepID=A0A512DTB0_9PROT|nr:hypothetical protein SAE02_38550 [Skermanella aerolata]
MTDQPLGPADSCPHQQLIPVWKPFQHLAQVGSHPFGAKLGRTLEQRIQIPAAQGEETEIGEKSLLAQAIGEFILAGD